MSMNQSSSLLIDKGVRFSAHASCVVAYSQYTVYTTDSTRIGNMQHRNSPNSHGTVSTSLYFYAFSAVYFQYYV